MAVLLCLFAAEVTLHTARHHGRVWRELIAFASAFGGIIGVALLLGLGVALLFLLDALFFQEKDTDPD
jgi:hypothetical protein